MRHYEIVFLVHPDQSEQVPAMIERYKGMISAGDGRSIASRTGAGASSTYPIAKVHKAHYVLLNIECDQKTLDGAHRRRSASATRCCAPGHQDGRGGHRALADGPRTTRMPAAATTSATTATTTTCPGMRE